jgi:predicted metal-binding protein
MNLTELTKQLGFETFLEFKAEMLVPETRIRAFCQADKCGNYAINYMCPPAIGSIEEIAAKIKNFQTGYLLQYSKYLDVKNEKPDVIRTQKEFHAKILQVEQYLKANGINQVWGLIGGNCRMCEVCAIKSAEPCRFPEQSRTSLEAIGVDVFGLLDKLGLESGFRPDKITWTGCVLVQNALKREMID